MKPSSKSKAIPTNIAANNLHGSNGTKIYIGLIPTMLKKS